VRFTGLRARVLSIEKRLAVGRSRVRIEGGLPPDYQPSPPQAVAEPVAEPPRRSAAGPPTPAPLRNDDPGKAAAAIEALEAQAAKTPIATLLVQTAVPGPRTGR
jgi:hypothetical protein